MHSITMGFWKYKTPQRPGSVVGRMNVKWYHKFLMLMNKDFIQII